MWSSSEIVFIYRSPYHDGLWRVEENIGDNVYYTVHDSLEDAIAYCRVLGREYEIC